MCNLVERIKLIKRVKFIDLIMHKVNMTELIYQVTVSSTNAFVDIVQLTRVPI